MAIEFWLDVDEAYAAEVDDARVSEVVRATLERLGVDNAELSIAITSDQEIQDYNRDYRGIDAPTDVLSFRAQEDHDGAGETAIPAADLPDALRIEIERYLGDVLIAFPYAQRQAAHFGNSAADEVLLLAVHGTLHLLGYDHDTPENEAEMWGLQEEILGAWGVKGLSQREYDVEDAE